MIEIGSHNSMSYLPPKYWWMRPFRFIAKCQSATIVDQYEKYGARFFDLRIKVNKKGEYCFAHGLMEFDSNSTSVEDTLEFLNGLQTPVGVRVLLERGDKDRFYNLCELWKIKYPNIKFYDARNKKDWTVIYSFGNGDFNSIDRYSSWCSTLKEDGTYSSGSTWLAFFPWLFAWLFNSDSIRKYKSITDKDFLLLDFLEYQ
jgi:hypothetical protein